jgi:hypothetical protein
MFLLGLLGFCQIVFLPGALLLRGLKFRGGLLQTLAYIFAASLILNFFGVLLLALLGLYRQWVVLTVIAVEAVALAWLLRTFWLRPLGGAIEAGWAALLGWLRSLIPQIVGETENRTVINALRALMLLVFGLLALDSILWMVRVFQLNLGTVFNTWDAVVSWNQWAVTWAQNRIPTDTVYYPQLLPANWSLTYVAMGSLQVQFFAKAVAPLFLLLTLALLFDLGLDARSMGFFIAVTLARLITKKFAGDFIADGYADIPVAFMGFLAIYALLKVEHSADPAARRMGVWLGALFAAGAALTKQAGGYLLLVYPLLAYLLVVRGTANANPRDQRRLVLLPFALALLLVLPWYGYRSTVIQLGLEKSNVEYVTSGIYGGLGVFERVARAFRGLGIYGYLVLFLLPALPFMRRAYRWLVGLVVLPFGLIWAAYFSYEPRNLSLAFPVIGLCCGMGLAGLAETGLDLLERLRPARLKLAALGAVALLAAALVGIWFPAQRMEQQQAELQQQIFNPGLNEQLVRLMEKAAPDVRILAMYPLRYIPGLEQRQVEYWFRDLDSYLSAARPNEIQYILLPNNADGAILAYVDEQLKTGEYHLILSDDHYIPSRLIRIHNHQP